MAGPERARGILAPAAAIAAVMVLVAAAAGHFSAREMIAREGHGTREFLDSIVQSEAIDASVPTGKDSTPALRSFAKYVERLPGIVRTTIYSPEGFIRYSSEANLIGVKFHDNDELARSLKGELIAAMIEEGDVAKDEQLGLSRARDETLLEVYLPVHDASGKLVCVVELYKRPAELLAALARVRAMIGLAAAIGWLALLAAFLALARRR